MAITLTRNGVTTAHTVHPENTPRKAVSLHTRDLSKVMVKVASLGGVELSLAQVLAQFQAHWTLARKESGAWENNYSTSIITECKDIMRAHGVSMTDKGTIKLAKKVK